jgi:cytochrome c553
MLALRARAITYADTPWALSSGAQVPMIPSAMAITLVPESLVRRRAAVAAGFAWMALCAAGTAGAQANDATTPAFKEVDSIEARVQGCVTCHGQGGQGTNDGYYPRIAGKPAEYLFNQLVGFRDGTRKYPPMNYLVAYLPDGYLHEMAMYYAKQRPAFAAKPASAPDAAQMQRGKALATVGDTAAGQPACSACHGKSLTGREPGTPGLVGVRATYLVAQLTRWRTGDRRAAEPDCMKRVATRLSEADIAAVAGWLAQQDVPADAAPERADAQQMPFACGSQR